MLQHGIVTGLFGFVVAVVLSRVEGWTATDFAWSMWISTLTLGSALLLLISLAVMIVPSFLKKGKTPFRDRLFVAAALGGFLLGVFVGFHYALYVLLLVYYFPFGVFKRGPAGDTWGGQL